MYTMEKNISSKITFFLAFFTVFLLTLESYQTYRYPILFIFIFSYLFGLHKWSFTLNNAAKILPIILTLVLIAVIGSTSFFQNNIKYTYIDFIFGTSLKLFLCIVIFYACNKSRDKIYDILGLILYANVFLFWLQFIIVYSTGYYIDVMEPITGQAQKYISGFSLPLIGPAYRPTGFYSEPSSFSGFLIALLLCRVHLSKRFSTIDNVTAITMIASLSSASFVFGVLFLNISIFFSIKSWISKAFLVSLSFLLALIGYFLSAIRADATDNLILTLRQEMFRIGYSQDTFSLIFGNGIFGLPSEIAGWLSSGSLSDGGIVAVNDLGLWFFVFLKFGIVGLSLFIVFIFKLTSQWKVRLIFMIFLLTKISYLHPTFLLTIFLIYVFRDSLLPKAT